MQHGVEVKAVAVDLAGSDNGVAHPLTLIHLPPPDQNLGAQGKSSSGQLRDFISNVILRSTVKRPNLEH